MVLQLKNKYEPNTIFPETLENRTKKKKLNKRTEIEMPVLSVWCVNAGSNCCSTSVHNWSQL